ncbi:MAG: hypothetical protein M1281_14130 [Chloroflexi bacterium]|nr:hypothetical protein [Chloroflexota bacterium]
MFKIASALGAIAVLFFASSPVFAGSKAPASATANNPGVTPPRLAVAAVHTKGLAPGLAKNHKENGKGQALANKAPAAVQAKGRDDNGPGQQPGNRGNQQPMHARSNFVLFVSITAVDVSANTFTVKVSSGNNLVKPEFGKEVTISVGGSTVIRVQGSGDENMSSDNDMNASIAQSSGDTDDTVISLANLKAGDNVWVHGWFVPSSSSSSSSTTLSGAWNARQVMAMMGQTVNNPSPEND